MYDSANQLIRENNQAGGFTHTWTYDNAGNITSRKEYAYTTGDLGAELDSITYTYNSKVWCDLLRYYGEDYLTYDGVGNVVRGGEWIYWWKHGRQLSYMTKGDIRWDFTYNADGMRTERSPGNEQGTYTYVYNGSKLTQMSVDGFTLNFAYDAAGTPLTVTVGNAVYYYKTNLQGDVVGILNSAGVQVVTYTYDAWGNMTYTATDEIVEYNPLTYRGYVYDKETGLYYLQSRYYNPEWGRFINADAFVSTGQGILGNNMFAYCLNNPIKYFDNTGRNAEVAEWWAATMWWLCGADSVLPVGDVVYWGGVIVLGVFALEYGDEVVDNMESTVVYVSPSPNDNDDEDDEYDEYDEYYSDESNFGGLQKMGKHNGKTPGNNQAQNKQFRDATRKLSKVIKAQIHREISHKGVGYHEIVKIAEDYIITLMVKCLKEWDND